MVRTAIILLISLNAYSQCSDKIVLIQDTCPLVTMSPETFTYYYKLNERMNDIKDSLPSLVKSIEEERDAAEELANNLESQILQSNRTNELVTGTLKECFNKEVQLEINNLSLRRDIVRIKKRNKTVTLIFSALSFVTGVYLTSKL